MRQSKHFKYGILAFGCLCLSGAATQAKAAGFYIQEQSAKSQGESFAGAAANPEDASTLFYNPAGMADLQGAQVAFGAALITPSASFTNHGSTLLGGPVGGGNGGDPFDPTPVPSLYVAAPVPRVDGLWAGLAVTSPFGLANDYNQGWFGRYDFTKTSLETIDIDPAVAYRINSQWSIGGGIDIQYANAELDSALPGPVTDGSLQLKGNSWGVGFNAGVLWDIDKATKVGLSYRSQIDQNLKGHLTTTPNLVLPPGTFAATATLALPDVVNFGVSHDFNDQLKVLGSVNWFNWSRFGAINPNVPALAGAPLGTTENYHDTVAVAGGAEWKQTDQLTFRGGLQFDQTPTGSFRDTRVPDSDRFWTSVGGSYAFTPAFSMDAAYTHIFMPDANVNVTRLGGAANVVGTSSNHVDILSLQGVVKF